MTCGEWGKPILESILLHLDSSYTGPLTITGSKRAQSTLMGKYGLPKDVSTGAEPQEAQASTTLVAPGNETLTLQVIMTAIQGVQTSLETRIDSVSIAVQLVRADLRKMGTRMKEAEKSIATLKMDTGLLQTQISKLCATNMALDVGLEDYRGHSWNNVPIIGEPKQIEGPAADLFVENRMFKMLQPRGLLIFFSVELAHWVPGNLPRPDVALQRIIARIFNYQDRNVILQTSRSAPPLLY
ncbi:hypothetical protein NDU88_001267 [Pleurodeles waltl]|uniref:Uncharacterized protein n=1 Tax=Pleurodeles waltl TaxID=8319 RepID=A0AAV7R6J6_PLEWA|nr:hypothetical protein NDU88_001267 [Pleurodeles waltl]